MKAVGVKKKRKKCKEKESVSKRGKKTKEIEKWSMKNKYGYF